MPQLLPLLVVVAKCAVRNQNALMQFQGHVEAGYEPVGEAFLQNFAKRGEVGAAVAVFHHGRPVVDIWAGLADKAAKKPWEENTLALLFSATKGMVATCCLMAAERGLLDLDGTIGSYWPEFGRGARKDITVRQLLNHRSGMIAIADELRIDDFYDREKLNGILESQEPVWNPGEFQGYHGVTYGPYVGELFFRAVGKTVGQFLASEVAGPLGADIFLGLPESEDPRVAHTITVGAGERILKALPYVLFNDVVERKLLKALANKASDTARAFGQPAELGTKGIDNFNLPKVRRLELGYANGFATARGLATMYSALAQGGTHDGVTLCRPESVEAVHPRQSFEDADRVLHKPIGWSQGFVKEETHLFSPHLQSFGHPGAGGALGFCDPTQGLSWAYIMNRMDFRLRSPRAIAISHAIYDCAPVTGSMTSA